MQVSIFYIRYSWRKAPQGTISMVLLVKASRGAFFSCPTKAWQAR
jgi:hypothetical protein